VHTYRLQLEDGVRLLLCSDGLTDIIDDEAIANILLETPRSSEACERLVQRALDAGGRDNVTVILARVLAGPDERGVLARLSGWIRKD
jgi:protein phosphatase